MVFERSARYQDCCRRRSPLPVSYLSYPPHKFRKLMSSSTADMIISAMIEGRRSGRDMLKELINQTLTLFESFQ